MNLHRPSDEGAKRYLNCRGSGTHADVGREIAVSGTGSAPSGVLVAELDSLVLEEEALCSLGWEAG
jgi:hypothetical protein